MNRRSITLLIMFGIGVAGGCGDDTGPAAPIPSFSQEPCGVTPALCEPVDGTIHDGTGDGTLYEPPGDPSVGAAGVWLGSAVAPRWCYADQNLLIADADKDWLADECEFELARAFAPAVALEGGCLGDRGEPYWAAKYFPALSRVRIAYLPAYYYDCGNASEPFPGTGDHYGDSEILSLDVRFNNATKHWEVGAEPRVWLSAHGDNSYSNFMGVAGLEYPVREQAYPRIWVAEDKHANYQSRHHCNEGNTEAHLDTCVDNTVRGRLLVYRGRNVGSRHVDHFINGVKTLDPRYQTNGKREYFYQRHPFGGWGIGSTDDNSSTPYFDHLMSGIFERENVTWSCFLDPNCIGPGPNPPTSATLLGTVEGPTHVNAFQTYSWTSVVTGGSPTYQAEWSRYYAGQGTTPWGTSSQTGNSNAGTWTGYVDRCGHFTLKLKTQSADGQISETDYQVGVTCPPSVVIQGPTTVYVKGTYTYSAVTSAMGSATFTWSWRYCNDAAGTSCNSWLTSTGTTLTPFLTPDCSGTGTRNFQVRVTARDSHGLTATDEHVTQLCGGPA